MLNKLNRTVAPLATRCLIAVAVLLNTNLISHAQDAEWGPDLAFGNSGKIVTDLSGRSSEARAVALQSDGKIVVAGNAENTATSFDFVLARYDSSGNLDAGFGNGGKVVTDFFGLSDGASAVTIQPDGKIILAGSAETARPNSEFALVRYNSDGSLDTSFGDNGKVTTSFGGSDRIYSMALQSDGKIVVAGPVFMGVTKQDYGLARYNKDGGLDPDFGNDGKMTVDFFGDIDEAFGVAVQPDGKIVVVGNAYSDNTQNRKFGLARLNSDGSLDAGFGSNGKIADHRGEAHAVALQPDGKIIIAGDFLSVIPNVDFGLARYNTDGSLDSDFGESGIVITDISDSADFTSAVALDADGKIVVIGSSVISLTQAKFAIARYNGNGALDSTFGNGGKLTAGFSGNAAEANAVAIQKDGSIILAGSARTADHNFALARFLKMTSPDFALMPETSLVLASRGRKVKVTVNIDRFVGFNQRVTLIAPDLSDIKIKVNPKSDSTTGRSIKFKLTIKAKAPFGNHVVTFVGRDATGRERSTTLVLKIE